MGDDEGGASFHQAIEGFLHQPFAVGVEAGCGLIQDQDGGISQQRPGDGDALALASTQLAAALAGLGEHHRLVFELGVVQELPYQEIGQILGIPVGTVKSRMFHTVRKLQEAMGEEQ